MKCSVAEVYYAYPGIPNGRSTKAGLPGFANYRQMDEELRIIAKSGIPTNRLVNAMCYRMKSQFHSLFQQSMM